LLAISAILIIRFIPRLHELTKFELINPMSLNHGIMIESGKDFILKLVLCYNLDFLKAYYWDRNNGSLLPLCK